MENKSSSSSSGSFCKKILRKLHRVTRGSHPQHINPTMTAHGDDGHHRNTQMNPVSAQQYSKPLETTHILKPANNTTASGYGGKIPINYENDSTQTPPLPPKNGQVRKVVSNTDFTKFIKQTKKRINRNTSNAVGDDHWENEDGGRNLKGLSSSGGGEDSFGGKDQFSEFIYQTKRRINRNMSNYGGSTSSRMDSINYK